MIDITNIDKAEILMKLYNASKQQGIGFYTVQGQKDLTLKEAQKIIARLNPKYMYIDYLYGRALKVNLRGNEFNSKAYDRDNGLGAAAKALSL